MSRRLLAAVFLCCACIVPAPTSGEKPQVSAKLPPAGKLELRNGANLGDKIEITTVTVDPGRASPGDTLHLSVSYHVLDTLPSDYMIFVHVEDVEGRVDRLNADHAPMQGQYPTSRWKKDEIVKDEFQVYVPPGFSVRGLNVLLGFWDPKTDARLPLKNPEAVRSDGNNRILVAQVPVVQPGQ